MSGDNIKAFYAFLVSVFALLGMVGVLGYFAMKTVSMSTIKYCRRRGGRHYPPASEPIALFLSLSLSRARALRVCLHQPARTFRSRTPHAVRVACACVRRWKGGAALTHPTASKGREWFAPPQVTRANAWRRLWQVRLPQQAGR